MSPGFINRVYAADVSLKNDPLSNWLLPGPIKEISTTTSEQHFLTDYLCDLYYEDVRGPYTKPLINYLPSNLIDSGRQLFRQSIVEPNLPTSINQIYKAYIDLYHYTHWMGSTVHGLRHFSPPNYQLIMPFGDKHVLELLRVMPTEYGRGLEIRPTKYPLKKILKEFVDYPISLQEGQHAYIYDDDQSINLVESLMTSGTHFYELLYSEFKQNPNSLLTDLLPDFSDAVTLYITNPTKFNPCLSTHNITALLLLSFQLNYLSR